MSSGVSPGTSVPGDNFSSGNRNINARMTGALVDFAGKSVEVKPPIVVAGDTTTAFEFVNPYPEFAFEKISTPDFGATKDCIARYTGFPINKPDYLNDYYFISIMRLVDKLMLPKYSGKVSLLYGKVKPES